MSDESMGWRFLLRTKQLDELELKIKQCRHRMVIGLPGCGKSVFLDQFAEKVGNNFLVLVVDVDSELNFLSNLVEKLKRSIFDAGLSLDGQCINDNPAMELVEVLRKAHSISGKRVVVVIKSFEQVRKLDEGERASVGNNLYYAFNSASVKEGPTLVLGSDRELQDVMAGAQRCKTKFGAMFGPNIYLHPFDLPQTVELLKLNGCEDLAVCEWLYERTGGNPSLMKLYYDEALGQKLSAALLEKLSTSPSCSEEQWVKNVLKLLGELKESGKTLADALGGMLDGTPLSRGCRKKLEAAYGLISGDCQMPSAIKIYLTVDSQKISKSYDFDYTKYLEKRNEILDDIQKGGRRSIFLRGQRGCGKTHFVKEIVQRLGAVKAAVDISSADLPDGLAEDALFGHVKGAHSTAFDDKIGYLEAANDTVLFIDEIAKVSVNTQNMLLRAITDKKVHRLGESGTAKTHDANFIFVCACWEDPWKLSQDQPCRFSPDLLERLQTGWELILPTLAQIRRLVKEEDVKRLMDECCAQDYPSYKATFTSSALKSFLNFIHRSPADFSATGDRPSNWRQLAALCTSMIGLAIKEKPSGIVRAATDDKSRGSLKIDVPEVKKALKTYYRYSQEEVDAFVAEDDAFDAIDKVLRKSGHGPADDKTAKLMVRLIAVMLGDSALFDATLESVANAWVKALRERGMPAEWKDPGQVVQRTLKSCRFGCSLKNFKQWVSENDDALRGKRDEN